MQESVSQAYSTVVDFLRTARGTKGITQIQWDEFHKKVLTLGLTPNMSTAIDLWTLENLERHRPELVRLRVLHALEGRFVSTQAHGRLLEAQNMGMLSPAQIEQVLDDLASRELQPIGADHIQKLIVKTWSRNIAGIRARKAN